MAHREARNTRTHHLCRTCDGAGSVVVNDTNPYGYGPDPQCDVDEPCSNPACEGGWVCFLPPDALMVMRWHRRLHLGGRRSSLLQANYLKARAKAMKPVRLPPDEVANPAFQQARVDVEAAIQMFGDFDRTFSGVFGRPLERAA